MSARRISLADGVQEDLTLTVDQLALQLGLHNSSDSPVQFEIKRSTRWSDGSEIPHGWFKFVPDHGVIAGKTTQTVMLTIQAARPTNAIAEFKIESNISGSRPCTLRLRHSAPMTTVAIHNVAATATADHIRGVFKHAGDIRDICKIEDAWFVEYETSDQADHALLYNNCIFPTLRQGRICVTSWATPLNSGDTNRNGGTNSHAPPPQASPQVVQLFDICAYTAETVNVDLLRSYLQNAMDQKAQGLTTDLIHRANLLLSAALVLRAPPRFLDPPYIDAPWEMVAGCEVIPNYPKMAVNGGGKAVTFEARSLPAGLRIDGVSGCISGDAPLEFGRLSCEVRAANSYNKWSDWVEVQLVVKFIGKSARSWLGSGVADIIEAYYKKMMELTTKQGQWTAADYEPPGVDRMPAVWKESITFAARALRVGTFEFLSKRLSQVDLQNKVKVKPAGVQPGSQEEGLYDGTVFHSACKPGGIGPKEFHPQSAALHALACVTLSADVRRANARDREEETDARLDEAALYLHDAIQYLSSECAANDAHPPFDPVLLLAAARLFHVSSRETREAAADSIQPDHKPDHKQGSSMTDASVLDVGTQCFYRKRDGTVTTVVVLKVHHDEQPPYYTIGIDATRHRATEGEKQTEREKLRPCSQGPWPEAQVTPEVTRQHSVDAQSRDESEIREGDLVRPRERRLASSDSFWASSEAKTVIRCNQDGSYVIMTRSNKRERLAYELMSCFACFDRTLFAEDARWINATWNRDGVRSERQWNDRAIMRPPKPLLKVADVKVSDIGGNSAPSNSLEPHAATSAAEDAWARLAGDASPRVRELMAQLFAMVGLDSVKDQILRVYNQVVKDEQMPEKSRIATQLNFTFMGNPGTGKTTVAGLFGRILNAVGARMSDTFVEVNAQQVLSAGEEAFGEMVHLMLNPKPSPEAVLKANANELRLLAVKQADNVKEKQEHDQKDEGGLQQRHDAAVKKLSDDANAAYDALSRKGIDLAKHQEKDQEKDLVSQGTDRNDLRQKQNREKSEEDKWMVTVQQELDQAQADLQQAQALASYNSPNTAAIAAAAKCVRDKQTTMRSVQTQQAATKERHQDEQAGVREKHQSEDRKRHLNHDQQKEQLKAEKDQLREKTNREKAEMLEAHKRESDALKKAQSRELNDLQKANDLEKRAIEEQHKQAQPTPGEQKAWKLLKKALRGQAMGDHAGGVLFIDEAHMLDPKGNKIGAAVFNYIMDAAERYRSTLTIILAGYRADIEKNLYGFNVGMPSRFMDVEFKDYDEHELRLIWKGMIDQYTSISWRMDSNAPKLPPAAQLSCPPLAEALSANRKDFSKGEWDVSAWASRLSFEEVRDDHRIDVGGISHRPLICKWTVHPDALEVAVRRVARGKGSYGFGNGRSLRNAFESAASKARARANFDPRAPELHIEDVIGPPPERKTMPELDAALTQLDAMEGLHEVKAQIYTFVQVNADNYRREKSNEKLLELKKNRLFWGNPGTGKSTVAEIYGKVLNALGLLSNGEVILKTAGDFIGSVVGESQNKAALILQLAQGKVLVIDEAYNLDDPQYGKQVLDTIVEKVSGQATEDIAVVLAGYEKEMRKMLREQNAGLSSRFDPASAFFFADYDDIALLQIFQRSIERQGFICHPTVALAAIAALSSKRCLPRFGNAREVDSLISSAAARASKRRAGGSRQSGRLLRLESCDFDLGGSGNPMKELEGLYNIKWIQDEIQTLQSGIMHAKEFKIAPPPLSNYLFLGNPGTGKTTVAKVMARVLHSLGQLQRDHVEITSAAELKGAYVGKAQENVAKAFESARGGILFVDEAYELVNNDYGREVITKICELLTVAEVQSSTVCILAGYEEEMNRMLAVNVGMPSRFRAHWVFPDWKEEDCAGYVYKRFTVDSPFIIDPDSSGTSTDNGPVYKQLLDGFGQLKWKTVIDDDGSESEIPREHWANVRDANAVYEGMRSEWSKRLDKEGLEGKERAKQATLTATDADLAFKQLLKRHAPRTDQVLKRTKTPDDREKPTLNYEQHKRTQQAPRQQQGQRAQVASATKKSLSQVENEREEEDGEAEDNICKAVEVEDVDIIEAEQAEREKAWEAKREQLEEAEKKALDEAAMAQKAATVAAEAASAQKARAAQETQEAEARQEAELAERQVADEALRLLSEEESRRQEQFEKDEKQRQDAIEAAEQEKRREDERAMLEESRQLAEIERLRLEAEKARDDEERRRKEEDLRKKLEEEEKRRRDDEKEKQIRDAAVKKLKEELEAKQTAEVERQRAEEKRRKEAQQREEEERRRRALEQEQKRKEEEERKRREDAESKRLEEARRNAAEEANRKAEDARRATEVRKQAKLRQIGKCPQGFDWVREGVYWRCGGGSHVVADAALNE